MEFKQYPKRWAILVMIVLLQISNGILWITFAPIVTYARNYYDTDVFIIDGLSLVFMAVFVPLGFAASWALNTLGLRRSVVVFAWVNMIGGWVRYLGEFGKTPHERLAIVYVGQILAAIAQPVILDCPTLMAATWFGENERAEANTVASIANPLGIAIGSVVSALLVNKESDIGRMLLILAIPASVACVLVTLFISDRPPTPPSASANEDTYPFRVGVSMVLRNPAFLILAFSFGSGIGLVSAITTVMGQVVAGNGYTDDDAGFFSAAIVGAGLLGAGLAGVFIDKTKRFTETLKVLFMLATASFVWFTLANKPDNMGQIIGSCCAMGFFCFACLPVGLELSVECTYPVNEGVSAGFLWLTGQVIGMGVIGGINGLKGTPAYFNGTVPYIPVPNTTIPAGISEFHNYDKALWFAVGVSGAAAFLILFMHTEYKRLNAENAIKHRNEETAAAKARAKLSQGSSSSSF